MAVKRQSITAVKPFAVHQSSKYVLGNLH